MLQHTVLFRLKPECINDSTLHRIEQVYSQLSRLLPDDVRSTAVVQNTVERSQNMDFMVTMLLKEESSLQTYLTHPVHVAFTQELRPQLADVCSFDCATDGAAL